MSTNSAILNVQLILDSYFAWTYFFDTVHCVGKTRFAPNKKHILISTYLLNKSAINHEIVGSSAAENVPCKQSHTWLIPEDAHSHKQTAYANRFLSLSLANYYVKLCACTACVKNEITYTGVSWALN